MSLSYSTIYHTKV